MSNQLTIKHAESAYMLGSARFKKFIEKFLERWTQPAQDDMALVMWYSIPQAQKDWLKEHYPEQYEQAEEAIARFKAGG